MYPGMACPIESAGRTLLIRLVGLAAIGVGLLYLTWRAAATLNLSVWWISVPLLAFEIQAFMRLALFLFSLWSVAPLVPAGRTSDLRTANSDEPEVLPFTAFEQIAERYPKIYTDLLVFRSPGH
ncbi:MAG TPA: hypothetical protein VIM05_00340 [Gaiellaceae bacterium]